MTRPSRLRHLAVALVLTVCGLPAASAHALTPQAFPLATNGQVFAFAREGNTLYLGGRFSRVGPVTGAGLRLDAGSGSRQGTPLNIAGTVSAAISDGGGGYYVGGNFTAVAGVARQNLAHITAAGTLDTAWVAGADKAVSALALSGSTLWVGGTFGQLDGTRRAHLGAVDATSGAVTGFAVGADGPVRSLVLAGGRLYAGGGFRHVGYATVTNVASIDPAAGDPTNASVSTTFNPAPDGPVDALAPAADGSLYVGGAFANIGGQARANLADVDATAGTVAATSIAPNPNGEVRSLLLRGTTLYAGGAFTTIGGQPRVRLAALSTANGTASTAFAPDPDQPVFAIAPGPSGSLVVGGQFSSIGAASRHFLARISTSDGSVVAGFAPEPDHTVLALAPSSSGASLFAGGDFQSAGGVTRRNLAAIDLATSTVTPFDVPAVAPSGDQYVNAIAVAGGRVWIGGQFTSLGGQPRSSLGTVGPDGTVTSTVTDVNNAVATLVASGGSVYAGGSFNGVNNVAHAGIAKFDAATGAVDAGFRTQTNGSVQAIAPVGTALVLGGEFGYIADYDGAPGVQVSRLAQVTASTGAQVSSFNATADNTVYALMPYNGALYEAGLGHRIDGAQPGAVAKLDPATGAVDPAFQPQFDNEVDGLLNVGSDLYAIGCYGHAAGLGVSQITRFDPATGAPLDAGYQGVDQLPDFDDYPRSLFQQQGCLIRGVASADGSTLYVGGAITSLAGVPQGGITAFSTADAPAATGGDGGPPGDVGITTTTPPRPGSPAPVAVQVLPGSTTSSAAPRAQFVVTTSPGLGAKHRVDVGVAVSCPSGGAACPVTLRATTQAAAPDKTFVSRAARTAAKSKAPPRSAGSARLSVAPGHRSELRFTLAKQAYAYLVKHHELTFDAVATASKPGGAQTRATRTVVLKLKRAKR